MRRSFIVLVCTVAVSAASLFAVAPPAAAEPGDLDGAFGTCGFREHAVQSQSTPIADSSGRYYQLERQFQPPSTIVDSMVRRTTAGAIDRSWGTNGRAYLPPYFYATAVTGDIDPQGRLVFAARAGGGGVDLFRFTVDGVLDTSFFGSGSVSAPFPAIDRIRTTPDSSVLIQASEIVDTSITHIQRYSATGTLEGFPPLDNPDRAQSTRPLAVGDDGSILVGRGVTEVVRWTSVGDLDPTFAPITPPVGTGMSPDGVADALVLPDGRSIIAFQLVGPTPSADQVLVGRFLGDGSPDPSFGFGGYMPVNGVPTFSRSLQISGTKVLLFANHFDGFDYLPRVVRLTAQGLPDPGFGRQGNADFPLYGLAGGFADTAKAALVALSLGDQQQPVRSLDARLTFAPLKQGAGLMLQWNGDAWPTRFGSDPGPECPYDTPYWPDDDNARGITTVRGKGGYVVDLYGAIHRFSIGLQHAKPAAAKGGPYWPGWDIVRGVAAKRNGTGGYVLDAYGALHPFHTGTNPQPPNTIDGPYWLGWDITRGVALMPDGFRGYILDGFGGLHRFTTPGHPLPPRLTGNAYWPGWDIARGVAVLGDGTGGYIVDAYGGTHPFGIGTHAAPPGPGPGAPYAPGIDWVRGYTFVDPKPVSTTVAGPTSAGGTTDSLDALIANAQRRGPTPVGPASP